MADRRSLAVSRLSFLTRRTAPTPSAIELEELLQLAADEGETMLEAESEEPVEPADDEATAASVDYQLRLEPDAGLGDHLEALERTTPGFGAGTAIWRWLEKSPFAPAERDYVYRGFARLLQHDEGAGWDNLPRQLDLDEHVWAFYQAWVDRYGLATVAEGAR